MVATHWECSCGCSGINACPSCLRGKCPVGGTLTHVPSVQGDAINHATMPPTAGLIAALPLRQPPEERP